jgi:hypothetical protein
MAEVQDTAIRGIAKRLQGRCASRVEALVAGLTAGVAVYRLLRSRSPNQGQQSVELDRE